MPSNPKTRKKYEPPTYQVGEMFEKQALACTGPGAKALASEGCNPWPSGNLLT